MEEDFEKLILDSLAGLKKQLGDLATRVTKVEESVDGLRKELTLIEGFLFQQSKAKGRACARTTKSEKGEIYCTKNIFENVSPGAESNYVLAGKRYYAKPGSYMCLVCTEFEK